MDNEEVGGCVEVGQVEGGVVGWIDRKAVGQVEWETEGG